MEIPGWTLRPTRALRIAGKQGAFSRLSNVFSTLMMAGFAVELRTVVHQQNWNLLPDLADYIATRLPFVEVWAIMQLENIGYGRMNWAHSFKDTSTDFSQLGRSVNLALGRGIPTLLYNFPLCSLPAHYRHLAPPTISDWKNKFLDECISCGLRSACGGFFEWYKPSLGFRGLLPAETKIGVGYRAKTMTMRNQGDIRHEVNDLLADTEAE
ncbi:hypothetical protein PY650_25220 [Rhizobium calliandrae]|uniref:His-Xaa-Ser system radical SAM maturase HxsC n=1 Tax=Rhizobium calliandrae TaxID=1312182 RepID=A0ABT7KKD7_9HYPH|nr:hypothetical protein [Rhizobium calliandrae]MDL2408881.1 hypothetical protein [Rhizobium calliandrae]